MQNLKVTRTVYKVSDFLEWQKSKSLVLSPSFQRRPVWKPGAKSFLIDTVVRGLPMPIIFLREQRTSLTSYTPRREVVDGQQRIRTLCSFIDPSSLPDYGKADYFLIQRDHNEKIANKPFSEFSSEYQQKILDYEFSVHILPVDTSDKDVLQIFARMNATGVKLNEQELRNAEWFGAYKTSMYELASEQLQRWRDWKIFSEYAISRMEEVELASEFGMLALNGLSKKSQGAIDSVYEDKDQDYPERDEFEKRFRAVMDSIDDSFGKEMPSTIFSRKTLFYSLFAFVYDVQFSIGSSLLEKKKAKGLSSKQVNWAKKAGAKILQKTAPNNVIEASERRTTDLGSREAILNYLHHEE